MPWFKRMTAEEKAKLAESRYQKEMARLTAKESEANRMLQLAEKRVGIKRIREKAMKLSPHSESILGGLGGSAERTLAGVDRGLTKMQKWVPPPGRELSKGFEVPSMAGAIFRPEKKKKRR